MVRVVGNSLPLVAVVLAMCTHCDHAFVVPVGRATTRHLARTRSSLSRVEAHPGERTQGILKRERMARRASMMASPAEETAATTGVGTARGAGEPVTRLGRISKRLRKMIRKAIMGYLPEEEAASEAAKEAAAAARRLAQTQVRDQRLIKDAARARAAAEEVVAAAHGEPVAAPDMVQLEIGGTSPLEAEDVTASLRKRMEEMNQSPQGVVEGTALPEAVEEVDRPEETEMERTRREIQARMQQRSLARREIQEKEALEKKAREERLQSLRGQVPGGRPASFDGDTAVAELPNPKDRGIQSGSSRPSGSASPTPQKKADTPKLASSEQIQRLERMFGSSGGEILP